MSTKSTLTKNPWGYVRVDPDALKDNPYVNPVAPRIEPPAVDPTPENPTPEIPPTFTPSQPINGRYIEMPQAKTYALGFHALQTACKKDGSKCQQPRLTLPDGREVYRANTFLENILARMNDWETLKDSKGNTRTTDDRKRYFTTWLDSSCGIAYQARTTKLKINLASPQLMGIEKGFNQEFMPIDYASFQGIELDSSKPDFVIDGWTILLQNNPKVYRDYLTVLKAIVGRDITPHFWVKQNTAEDQLRAVYVSSLDNYSGAYGNVSLNNLGRFLRRSP